MARSAYRSYRPVLSLVPEKCMSEELVALSARLYPESLSYAPSEFVSRDLCLELVERDPMNLRYVPMPDKKLVDSALQANPRAILAVPESMLTLKRCRDALRRDPTILLRSSPKATARSWKRNFGRTLS